MGLVVKNYQGLKYPIAWWPGTIKATSWASGFDPSFYPRPVLAFGYCRCLRLCVSLCVNHLLVRAITRDPFKLGSPNLKHRCKRPWLRCLLFWGVIDLYLQGQICLHSQNLPNFELVRAITHHPVQARTTKFRPEVQNTLIKIPVVLGVDWAWHVKLNLFSKSCLLYPPLQRSWKGGILVSPCPSVRLSVCGQNRVRSVSSTILIGSIS